MGSECIGISNPAGEVILWENGEICTLGGGFTEELRGSMEVGGGVEGLQAQQTVNDLFGQWAGFRGKPRVPVVSRLL